MSAAVWAENPLSDISILLTVPFSSYTVCYRGGCIMGNVQCMFSCLARERGSVWAVFASAVFTDSSVGRHLASYCRKSYVVWYRNKNETG